MVEMDAGLLDLVCGPASPLPETYQRYRLVAHLGSGGQADVYRAVRLCGGVASAPMTVKVFRIDPQRPLADELRSWDKGDAALMDLNNRGVTGICRRADGFYGPPPHRPGQPPEPGNAVPYQVYDYLHGVNLREYLGGVVASGPGPRLSAEAALRTLATILQALHHPESPACPVLHMDVKPSNVMVLTSGEVRLIDFTGARYWRPEEITSIAYTPGAAGPEALEGQVDPAYDVHGFGSVAYFLVTGSLPREHGAPPPDRHPLLAGRTALREHLCAVLAPRPEHRPATTELYGWVARLATLVRSAGTGAPGVDWAQPADRPAGSPAGRAVGRASVVTGTETDAYARIERLERELVRLRAADSPAFGYPSSAGPLLSTAAFAGRAPAVAAPAGPLVAGPAIAVNPPTTVAPATPTRPDVARRARPPVGERARVLRIGSGATVAGLVILGCCWLAWAVTNRPANLMGQLLTFALVLAVGAGVFALCRLLGRYVWERLVGRARRSARMAHLVTAAYLAAVGVDYLAATGWAVRLWQWAVG